VRWESNGEFGKEYGVLDFGFELGFGRFGKGGKIYQNNYLILNKA
jgi:hypothetical protein